MRIDVNSMITLNNKEKYADLEKINVENTNYYYVALVNGNETDIKDEYKIIKLEEKNGINYVIEVVEQALLTKLLPLFLEKMPN